MRTVLVVSPHFPPVSTPDLHRVRLSLPHYPEFGWRPVVLAVRPDSVEAVKDAYLSSTVPCDVPAYHANAVPARWTRVAGLSAIGIRAWPFLAVLGARLIRQYRPDLVFFSTTMFPVLPMGRLWRMLFGVPYVIDLQDPWVGDPSGSTTRPNRPAKYRLAQRMHRTLERWTMRRAGGIIAVSAKYHETVCSRYGGFAADACRTIPFGGTAADIEAAARAPVENRWFDPHDERVHGLYVGVLGHVMRTTCEGICLALREGIRTHPAFFGRVRLHFVGTDYATDNRAIQTIKPIADSFGLHDAVQEDTRRVPYLQALHLLQHPQFLLIVGSNDPEYTASKVYPYILAQRPVLAVLHRASSAVDVLRSTRAATIVTYGDGATAEEIARLLLPAWTELLTRIPFVPDTDWTAFEPYTAREMTRQQCELFDRVVAASGHGSRKIVTTVGVGS